MQLNQSDVVSSGTGVSRRAVVRAGANAAWAVPLISVATAAPALAVSGQCRLHISGFTAKRVASVNAVDVVIRHVKNLGTAPSGQVTVVVRVPKTQSGPFSAAPTLVGPPSPGWTYVGRTGTGPWDFTFISNTGVPAKKDAPELTFSLQLGAGGKTSPVKFTATAVSQGCGSASRQSGAVS